MSDDPTAAGPRTVTHRWRIHPVDHPEATSAEVLWTTAPNDPAGRLEIRADDPSMRALIAYFLADPHDHRPQYFPETGTVGGPHTGAPGRVDRALMIFHRNFSAFQAERTAPY